MKKLFTFLILACAFLVGQAATEQIFCVNYAELVYQNFDSGTVEYVTRSGEIYEFGDYKNQKFSYPNVLAINDSITISRPSNNTPSLRFNNNSNIGLYCGSTTTETCFGLLGLQKGDILEVAYNSGSNYQISVVENLSTPVKLSEISSMTLSKNADSEPLTYPIVAYTMNVEEDGNAGFSILGSYIAYIKITRVLDKEMTFYAGGNANQDLPTNGGNVRTVSYGNNNYFSFGLFTSRGTFRKTNSQDNNIEVNGKEYSPLFMASNTYYIANSHNVTSIKLYATGAAATTSANVNGGETLNGVGGEPQVIELTGSTSFSVNRSNIYGVFVIEYTPEDSHSQTVTVSVGDALKDNPSFEWTKDLATGTWNTENPFNEVLIIENNDNDNVNLGLVAVVTPMFEYINAPKEWTSEEASGMNEWMWKQMTAIKGYNDDVVVDAYYSAPASNPLVSGNSISPVIIPCSGKYQINVYSLNPYDVNVEDGIQTFTVYPSTNLTYTYNWKEKELTEGVNISGYTVENQTMVLDESLAKDKYRLYIPGVYLLSEIKYTMDYTASEDTASELRAGKRKVTTTGTTTNGGIINLSGWDGSQATLYLSLTKNGATTATETNGQPASSFIIKTGTGNEVTSVEAIEAAEGEAVYYNLQGQKVMNPERGIFIKVQNGKVSKVIL